MPRTSKKSKSIEESFQELEDLIKKLESEELNLEESFLMYQKGMKLLKVCSDSIDRVEKQLILLEEEETNEG